jgi:predicted TIM-barrel fold metal-dependent hydrolase
MIGVARRHQKVYIDTAAHRPRYFATPGSGWEMLMQFGNTLLQDRIVFASGWRNYQMPIKDVVEEMKTLPLKDDVKEKWLHRNAARIFQR